MAPALGRRRTGAIVGGSSPRRNDLAGRVVDVCRHTVLAEGAESKWRIAVEKGFAPLTVGLIMATSLVMSRAPITTAGISADSGMHGDLCIQQGEPADRCFSLRAYWGSSAWSRHAGEAVDLIHC